jgi:epidermal growth factor receptor substrate 15
MHLIASYKTGAMRGLPQTLPPGLYEAASRRGAPARTFTGSRPTSASEVPPVPAIPRQFTGSPIRTQSPLTRQQFAPPVSAQSTGGDWLISPHEKAEFDRIFNTVDTARRGVINGEQAVTFFSNSRLPEEVLAQIWDLADINSEGQLNKDEFAVAMFLIRQQRGKRDSRGVLPSTLPSNLIPPSMRHQNIAPSQPTAPAFDNPANITQPKSAADDLFGLDALNTLTQAPQSTGDSFAAFKSSIASTAPTSSPPQLQPTTFKPFIPSSNFGQTLQPNFTGSSRGAQPQVSDDLLGDNDPEESRKLTPDTTELANLSNQVGTLSKQMQEVQTKRSTNDQELSQTAQQKRDFEMRLSQLRGLYEQEVKDVKVQDERLVTARNEVKKLQQEIAMVEGSYQDLQTHHQQSTAALDAELKENAILKDRIRQRNADIAQIKPLLEKLKSDLRQQKGLVAINKKQLATLDQEHDRLKAEQESVSRELEEQARAIPESAIAGPAAVVSPAASTASQGTNPFFRRTTIGSSELVTAPPATSQTLSSEHQSTFDSIFGPSFTVPSSSTPPPISFGTGTPTQAREIPAVSAQSSEGPGIPTPSMSPPPSTFSDSPRVVEPPPPPQSRQITSSHLPLKDPIERSDSVSSSVKVSAPASRFGGMDHSRVDTPVGSTGGARSDDGQLEKGEEKTDPKETAPQAADKSYFGQGDVAPPTLTAPAANKDAMEELGQPSPSPGIPGAFPDDATPRSELPPRSAVAAGKQPENLHTGLDDPFSAPRDQSRSPVAIKDDFDSAFNDLKPASPNATGFLITNGAATTSRKEFPDITEFDGDDTSDTESEKGFDDNFTTASPAQKSKPITDGTADDGLPASLVPPRPTLESTSSHTSTLPSADAQMSPPTYNESFPQERRTSFPPEFKGLLPSREDPTHSPGGPHSMPSSSVAPVTSIPTPPVEGKAAAMPKSSNGFGGFDDDVFGGLAAAKESDEGEQFGTPHHGGDDFDPAFDSPMASKSPPVDASNNLHPQTNSTVNNFHDFESNLGPATQASPTAPTSSGPATHTSSDWDAIFAGLDSPPTSAGALANEFPSPPTSTLQAKDVITPAPAPAPEVPKRPQPGRAISMGTEHDDPILKRLTGMGYPRDQSLAALEKFDYNIDKVSR